jgi:hypothetical protein
MQALDRGHWTGFSQIYRSEMPEVSEALSSVGDVKFAMNFSAWATFGKYYLLFRAVIAQSV